MRLKAIESGIDDFPPDKVEDVRWMVEQIRGWQKFAKRVVDFGDVLRDENATIAVLQGYEGLFAPNGRARGKDAAA